MKDTTNFFLMVIFFIGCSSSLLAQRNKQPRTLTQDEAKMVNKDAGSAFNYGDYNSALKGYKELIKTSPGNTEYNYRLGVSILMTNSIKDKAYEYLENASKGKDVKKEVWYYLGLAYMHAGMWDEAIEAFNTFKSGGNSKFTKDLIPPDRMIEMCRNGKSLTANPVTVTFENMGKLINTPYDEYNPFVSADGKTLAFTARRKGNIGGFIPELGMFTADIWWTQYRDTSASWGKAKGIGTYVNSDWDEELTGMTPDGNQLIVYFDNELAYGDIGVSISRGRNWQAPVMMSDVVNVSNSMESSGCISNDGRVLYFASDRKGGEGGFDIWYSVRQSSGEWSPAQNLGNVINTKYDETAPYISLDGQTLYFCSKGHNTIGGYDIFYTQYDSTSGKWSTPVNLGYPINTVDDQTSISLEGNGRYAYIAAIRPEGFGERDIYRINLNDASQYRAVISGTVTAGTTSKTEVRTVSLIRSSDKKVVAVYSPYYISNKYVLAAKPGEYILRVEGYGFKPVEEELSVPDESPLTNIVKDFSVTVVK